MLKTTLLHPEILYALASAGHQSQILIGDGNYPIATASNPLAKRVYLNLAPGLLGVPEILRVLTEAVPIEAARVMQPNDGTTPLLWPTYRDLLPGIKLQPVEKWAFYEACRAPTVALVIASGETRIWANLLLTIGVVAP